jgi:hypothetical protein
VGEGLPRELEELLTLQAEDSEGPGGATAPLRVGFASVNFIFHYALHKFSIF